jgi:hypothetical protein
LATGRIVLRDAAGVRVTPEDLAPGGRLASSRALVDAAYEKQVRAPRERAAVAQEAKERDAIALFRAAHPDGPRLPTVAMAEAKYETQVRELAKQREHDEAVDAWLKEPDVARELDAAAEFMTYFMWNCTEDPHDYGELGANWGCVPASPHGNRYVVWQQDVFGESAAPYRIVPELRAWMRTMGIIEVGFGITGGNGLCCWTMIVDASDFDADDPAGVIGAWLDARYAGVAHESHPRPVHGLSISALGASKRAPTDAASGSPARVAPLEGDAAVGPGETAVARSESAQAAAPVAAFLAPAHGTRPPTARRDGKCHTVDETPRNLEVLRSYSRWALISVARDVGALLPTGEAWTAWESMDHEERARHVLAGLRNWDEVVRRAAQRDPG